MKLFILIIFFTLGCAQSLNSTENYKAEGYKLHVPENSNSTLRRDGRIAYGFNAAVGQFPWAVRLQIRYKDFESYCSASLISSKFVLGCRHCMFRPYVITIQAWMGGVTLDGRSQAAIYSEFYWWIKGETFSDDIALMRLYYDFYFTNNIRAIRLPSASQRSTTFVGMKVVAQGYGAGRNLQYGNFKVIANADNLIRYVGDSDERSELEGGDSGGPLVIYENGVPTLIGVNVAVSARTSYAVGLTKFLEFIRDITGIPMR